MICCNNFPPNPASAKFWSLSEVVHFLTVEASCVVGFLVFLSFACFYWVSGPEGAIRSCFFWPWFPWQGLILVPHLEAHVPAQPWLLPGKVSGAVLVFSQLPCSGWDCGTDPDPSEPLAPPSALTLSFVWPLFSSFILGSILLFHSVKPLFTFPKVSFTLVGVLVFSQLLQKFVSLCSDLGTCLRCAPVLCIKISTKLLVFLTFSLKYLCQAFIWCAGLFQLL